MTKPRTLPLQPTALVASITWGALCAALWLPPSVGHAQSVILAGLLGSKVLLVVGRSPPRAMGAGDEYQGVKVIATTGEAATVEVGGVRRILRFGEPVSVGGNGVRGIGNGIGIGNGNSSSSNGKRIMLIADSRGYFVNSGSINGQVMQYMIDTGASTVAIGRADADRMGLKYQNGQPVQISTANGMGQGWLIKLDSVRIGDVEVFGVDAIITAQPMPYVLLGNNFLTEFQMTRINDQMVLEKRNR